MVRKPGSKHSASSSRVTARRNDWNSIRDLHQGPRSQAASRGRIHDRSPIRLPKHQNRLDLAKNVFQVHGVDASGGVVLRRQLRRGAVEKFFAQLPPCTVGVEACGSAHHWARVIGHYGHQVRLMPPAYVKPYVKRNKNDGRDAEAIFEAVSRPTMRFVPVKSVEQQATMAVHTTRALLVRQRTMVANSLRAALSELGIVAAQGIKGVREVLVKLGAPREERLEITRGALLRLAKHWQALEGCEGVP